jgi:hypothetical protein
MFSKIDLAIIFAVVPAENSESMEKSSDLSCPAVVSRTCSHSARRFFHGSLAAARRKDRRLKRPGWSRRGRVLWHHVGTDLEKGARVLPNFRGG